LLHPDGSRVVGVVVVNVTVDVVVIVTDEVGGTSVGDGVGVGVV